MPHTPGYEHVTFIPKSDFPEAEDKELVLTFENPYSSSHAFSECVIFTLSQGNGAYGNPESNTESFWNDSKQLIEAFAQSKKTLADVLAFLQGDEDQSAGKSPKVH